MTLLITNTTYCTSSSELYLYLKRSHIVQNKNIVTVQYDTKLMPYKKIALYLNNELYIRICLCFFSLHYFM